MSIRTIIVGIIAALCGICAAAGVMTLLQNSGASRVAKKPPVMGLMIAKVDLDMGQLIEENLVSRIDWHSETLPPGSFSSVEEIKGKYAVGAIMAGEVISAARTSDAPTMLQPLYGMRALAIDAKSVSVNLGRNIVPGNRVDIIWDGKISGDGESVSIRMLQNVKILAVGRLSGEVNNSDKSITLELKPNMDQDLIYAQSIGSLSLSLRNASDNEGIEPIELVNLTKLLAEKAAEREEQRARAQRPSAWEEMVKNLQSQIAGLEQRLNNPTVAEPVVDRTAFARIGKGMRAITIQTPTESTALAGLLEPGDRVDLHLNVTGKRNLAGITNKTGAEAMSAASETLIENIEVLAVDTKLYTVDKDGEKKMSDSVTLIVNENMQHDIARAGQIGTLALTLRGEYDRLDGPPRTLMTVDQFVQSYLPIADGIPLPQDSAPSIRTYRGTAAQEIPFAAKRPGKVVTSL